MNWRINSYCRLLLLVVMILSLAGCGRVAVELDSNQVALKLPDGYLIKADVANTAPLREQGLSGRVSLAPDAGMWFVFEQDGTYPFWMPEMNFPIDIIWVGSDFKVAEVVRNVSPEPGVDKPQLKRYTNRLPVRYVLEVPSGTSLEHKVGIGSRLELISS